MSNLSRLDAIRRKARLHLEILEDRIALSWGGTPPESVTVPTVFTSVTLNGTGDATGNASIATTEIDWYRFTATANGTYQFDATTPSSNLDPVAALYSSSGTRLGYNDDVVPGSNTDSQFTVSLTNGQVYYFGVTNYNGTGGGSYTWTINGPTPQSGPPDDAYEDNDTLATAWNLGTVTSSTTFNNLRMSDGNDYFQFTMTGPGTAAHTVSISFLNSQGNLDLILYNSSGVGIRSSAGTGNGESISLDGLAAGTYTARIYTTARSSIRSGVAYSLNINPGVGTLTNEWTVMVYITASNLYSFAHEDVNEMEFALNNGLPSNVKIVVFWDQSASGTRYATGAGTQAAWGTAGRAVLSGDNNINQVGTTFEILAEQNTGSGATLTSFVSWAMTAAPANNYSLMLWNHGSGIDGSNYDDSDGAGFDYLTITETATALSAAGMPRFKVLGYDACLMAMGEIGYSLRNNADVFVGSEELVPGAGHDYRTLLDVLKTNPGSVTAEQLGAGMVTSYFNQYGPGSSLLDTYSATRTSQYAAFATALQTFANTRSIATAADRTAMRTARNSAAVYGEGSFPDFRDLGHFMTTVANNASITASIRTAATAVNTALANLVVAKTADGRASSGVAIYLPGNSYDSSYASSNAAFNSATGWGSFANWLATGASSWGGGGGGEGKAHVAMPAQRPTGQPAMSRDVTGALAAFGGSLRKEQVASRTTLTPLASATTANTTATARTEINSRRLVSAPPATTRTSSKPTAHLELAATDDFFSRLSV